MKTKFVVRRELRHAFVFALTGIVLVASLGSQPLRSAAAAPADEVKSAGPAPETPDVSVPEERRAEVLGTDFASSKDDAVTTIGDSTGFHVLFASEASGYEWRRIASLAVEGVETDQWIGNTCRSSDGKNIAVVYSTRTSTNDDVMYNQGAWAAVVNLESGKTTHLGQGFTISHFNPGCGISNDFSLTAFSKDGSGTQLSVRSIQAPAKKLLDIEVDAPVTSAVPVAGKIVASSVDGLVEIDAKGQQRLLNRTTGPAYYIRAAAGGRVGYVTQKGEVATAWTTPVADSAAKPTSIASGPIQELGLAGVGNGDLTVLGKPTAVAKKLPANVKIMSANSHATLSKEGSLAIEKTYSDLPLSGDLAGNSAVPVKIDAIVSQTKTSLAFGFEFEAETLSRPATIATVPKTGAKALQDAPGSATNPIEAERACAVPRNDPQSQALQPKPRQVEWAVDQAVTNSLTVARDADWMDLGMPAYTPQQLFPLPALNGGGRIPAQVMLGVLAQESNLWQASRYTTPGVTGNPLIGNFYGNNSTASGSSFWSTDFYDSADCGYGVSQVTDGMRLASMTKPGAVPALPYQTQRAVALDFAVNIAAGTRILAQKWNQTRAGGLTINNGAASKIENWFYAVWAYNTGYYEQGAPGEPWGIGWSNNPANPKYDLGRAPFLSLGSADAANPQDWPYPEKVMGFAAYSLTLWEDATTLVAGYRVASWNGDEITGPQNRLDVKPPLYLFCQMAINSCDPAQSGAPCQISGEPKCWFNGGAVWKNNCPLTCGNELLRFYSGYAYQADANSFPPLCSLSGLPTGALVVDNVPASVEPVRQVCNQQATHGNFGLTFSGTGSGKYESKMDLHQLGGGFNSHFYFSHTRFADDYGGRLKISGKWTLGQSLTNKWTRVFVHMPDHGAWTQQAAYTINMGNGTSQTRTLLQRRYSNEWVPLGVFKVNGVPTVTLSNVTQDGKGVDDIAWDAVAFQPLSAKPTDFVVALGDSYTSGEGVSDTTTGSSYFRESDNNRQNEQFHNGCHRSFDAWPRQGVTTSAPTVAIGDRADSYASSLDFRFLSCSGAETENLLPFHSVGTAKPVNGDGQKGVGQFHELSQLDQGFLDVNTTLVVFSIGGNDMRFEAVIKHCMALGLLDLVSCGDYSLPDESQDLSLASTDRLENVLPQSLEAVITQIRLKAPNATIVLAGYPMLFESGGGCFGFGIGLSRDWLNEMSVDLSTTMESVANGLNTPAQPVLYADPQEYFTGHNVCGNDPWIHNLVWTFTPGDRSKFGSVPWPGSDLQLAVSNQSFHPKFLGATAYAYAMSEALGIDVTP